MAKDDDGVTTGDLVFRSQEAASGSRFNVKRREECAIDAQRERESSLSIAGVQTDSDVSEGDESFKALRSFRDIFHVWIRELADRARLSRSHDADHSAGLRDRYRPD